MIREIYCKLPSDRGYEHRLETTDEIQQIIQQIRMVLGTKPGDILGQQHFGIDLQQYLFSYNDTPEMIKFMVNSTIGYYINYDTEKYSVGCEVNYGHNQGDTSDYAVIDITINQRKILGILVNQD